MKDAQAASEAREHILIAQSSLSAYRFGRVSRGSDLVPHD